MIDQGGGVRGAALGRWLWLGLAALALTFLVDCGGGCGCGQEGGAQIPATPAERLEVFAGRLPAQTDLALFFTDMTQVRQSVQTLSEKFSGNVPLDAYRQELRQVIGIDLLDASTYEAAGVHPEAGFSVGYYRDAPVALLYVTDRAKFEAGVIASLKRFYRIEQTPQAPVEGLKDAFEVKDVGVQFAWSYLPGGLTVMVGQGVALEGAPRPAVDTLKEVAALEQDASLLKARGFDGFQAQVGTKWPATVYMNTAKLLALYQSVDPSLKTYQKEILTSLGEQLQWMGAGWKADPAQATGELFLGVAPETLEKFKGLDQPSAKAPNFKLIVSDRAYAVMRISANAELFWREYYKLMPARQQEYFKKIVGNLKSTMGVDLEKELIGNLTGHGLLAVYDINPLMTMAREATQRMKVVTVALHLQLARPDEFGAVMTRLTRELGTSVQVRSLPGGITVWGFDPNSRTAPPFALYLKDDLLTLASSDLGDEAVAAMLTGEGPQLRKKVTGEATQELLAGAQSTGLYINMPRIRDRLGLLGGRVVRELLGPPREVTVQVGLHPQGLSASGSMTFTGGQEPTPEGDAQDDKGEGDKGEDDKAGGDGAGGDEAPKGDEQGAGKE